MIFDRDAGLSIKAWLDVNDNNHDAVAEVLNAYVGWVQKVLKRLGGQNSLHKNCHT